MNITKPIIESYTKDTFCTKNNGYFIYLSNEDIIVPISEGNPKNGVYMIEMPKRNGVYLTAVELGPTVKLVSKEEHPEYFL